MAGALNIQLEKQGCYMLGDDHGISPEHIDRALTGDGGDGCPIWGSGGFAHYGTKNLLSRTFISHSVKLFLEALFSVFFVY